ncbi:MAG TPA: PAS domain S-box protein [Polyangia bacterium]|nr:PAS domain S-box protein [Polyangia bacterium]
MTTKLQRAVGDDLLKAAQVLAIGTGESQLHAAAEHIAHALTASSVSVLAIVADPEAAYIVADSDESEVGRVRLPLAQYPHIQRALETGEVTFAGAASLDAPEAPPREMSVVFPLVVSRKPVGALIARFSTAERPDDDVLSVGRLATAMIGMVLGRARALDPIRERARRITLQDFQEERRVRALEPYRSFLDSASDGVFVVDAAGRVLYMNRAAEEVTGWARDGLAGGPLAQIVPEEHRARLEVEIAHAVAGETVVNFDLDLVTTSGDRPTFSVASIGILSEHEAAIFSFRDVTLARELERELRRTTEFLERILNSTVDGIIAADLRGTILLFNQGAERICGHHAIDVIGKMNVRKLYPAGVAEEVMRLVRSAEHGGGGRLEPVRRDLVTSAGERVPVSISAALVFDDAGHEIATVGIFSDLRERLRMEERLASAQAKLDVSEKQAVAIELAGAAAHELNQPLTSVMGYAQMLLRKLGAGDARVGLAQTIFEEAERMATIVRKLGSLVRYETKSYVGSAQILDLERSTGETEPERTKSKGNKKKDKTDKRDE